MEIKKITRMTKRFRKKYKSFSKRKNLSFKKFLKSYQKKSIKLKHKSKRSSFKTK